MYMAFPFMRFDTTKFGNCHMIKAPHEWNNVRVVAQTPSK